MSQDFPHRLYITPCSKESRDDAWTVVHCRQCVPGQPAAGPIPGHIAALHCMAGRAGGKPHWAIPGAQHNDPQPAELVDDAAGHQRVERAQGHYGRGQRSAGRA